MKIALIGYGKMGKEIEKISIKRKHEIICKVDKNSELKNLNGADIAINFCTPKTAYKNIEFALKKSIPVVSGTTGWISNINKIEKLSKIKKTGFLYSSNFSLGVNLFFKLNKNLAEIMKKQNQYSLNIEETHHVEKIDKPSGTAIKLANDIIEKGLYKKWSESNQKESIPIKSFRVDHEPGSHVVKYNSEIDSLEIKHTAKNRKGFALGAVIAAEWIVNKKGIFTMSDVINDLSFKF